MRQVHRIVTMILMLWPRTWHEHARREGDHLILIVPVVDIAVQDHLADLLQRELILIPNLGRIHGVKLVAVLVSRVHGLNVQCPFQRLACRSAWLH